MSFWTGFEKRAYDYEHEVSELEKHYARQAKETPMDPRKAVHTGMGFGGVGGALLGGIHVDGHGWKGRAAGAVAGGLMGGALGSVAGRAAADVHKGGIEHAKHVTGLPKKERMARLRHIAREDEYDSREAHEWARTRYLARQQKREHGTDHFTAGFHARKEQAEAPKAPTGGCPSCGSHETKKTPDGYSCGHCGNKR